MRSSGPLTARHLFTLSRGTDHLQGHTGCVPACAGTGGTRRAEPRVRKGMPGPNQVVK